LIPLTVRYGAIRELREFVATVPGARTGTLFGAHTADSIVIDHFAGGPGTQRAIGFFRVQPGGWPSITEADRQRMSAAMPAGGLLLIVRTIEQRPWPATLYAMTGPPRKDAGAAEPVLAEFPFDEYLLRNGWLTELAPPLPPEPPQPRQSPRRWMQLGVAMTALLLAGSAAAYRWLPMSTRPATAGRSSRDSGIPDGASLGLKMTANGSSLELTWNRRADAVQFAAGGSLAILNGPVSRVIELTPDQLREGRILYMPLPGVDVDARLEVRTTTGGSEAESVQLIGFNTAPAVPLPALSASIRTTRGNFVPRAERTSSAKPASADAPEPEAETIVLEHAVKPFRGAPANQPAAGGPAPDVPQVAAPRTVAAVNLNAIAGTTLPLPPPPAQPKPVPTGGHIEEAQLISGHVPEYPRQAREARISGNVELEITIAANGHVTAARAIKGDPRLRMAALEAVKQWVYRPTMLNGKAIEAQRQIVLNFKP
jgi:TonB family protein